jgi:hypothetical protein
MSDYAKFIDQKIKEFHKQYPTLKNKELTNMAVEEWDKKKISYPQKSNSIIKSSNKNSSNKDSSDSDSSDSDSSDSDSSDSDSLENELYSENEEDNGMIIVHKDTVIKNYMNEFFTQTNNRKDIMCVRTVAGFLKYYYKFNFINNRKMLPGCQYIRIKDFVKYLKKNGYNIKSEHRMKSNWILIGYELKKNSDDERIIDEFINL